MAIDSSSLIRRPPGERKEDWDRRLILNSQSGKRRADFDRLQLSDNPSFESTVGFEIERLTLRSCWELLMALGVFESTRDS